MRGIRFVDDEFLATTIGDIFLQAASEEKEKASLCSAEAFGRNECVRSRMALLVEGWRFAGTT